MADTDLVTCEWLNKQIEEGSTNVVILDVSWYSDKDGREKYLREHIPGAVYFNVMQDVELTPLHPRKVAPTEAFQKNARNVGVNSDSHVVLYSDTNMCGFFLSGRAWWMFKYFGHDSVSVLDGGWQKWISGGYSKSPTVPEVKEGNFSAKISPNFRRSLKEMRDVCSQKSSQIMESRPPGIYAEGHIPGAKNLPGASIADTDTGVFKDKGELSKLFESVGIDLCKPVVMYCSGGMSSCSLFMAANICGAKDISLYPEGYSEWKQTVEPELIEKSTE